MGLSASFSQLWHNPDARKQYLAGTAATFFLFASMLLVPVVGLFVGILTPLPSLLFLYRWGLGVGMWLPATVALVSALLFPSMGLAASLPFLLGLLVMGVFLSLGMGLGWSVEKTVVVPVGILFVLGSLMTYLALSDLEDGVAARLERDIQTTISGMVQELAPESPERNALEESLASAVPFVVRVIPGVLLSALLVLAWLNILAAQRYCLLHDVAWPDWPRWSLWRAPEPLVWGVIGSGVVLLLPVLTLKFIALNVLLVLGTVYFFQGLSLTVFYLEKWKLPIFLRALIFAFILLQQFVTLGIMLFGFFDVWFDFRKNTEKGEKA